MGPCTPPGPLVLFCATCAAPAPQCPEPQITPGSSQAREPGPAPPSVCQGGRALPELAQSPSTPPASSGAVRPGVGGGPCPSGPAVPSFRLDPTGPPVGDLCWRVFPVRGGQACSPQRPAPAALACDRWRGCIPRSRHETRVRVKSLTREGRPRTPRRACRGRGSSQGRCGGGWSPGGQWLL